MRGRCEKAYYEGWLQRTVFFHRMGHSHGGNVVNEATRRAAESPRWPKGWKIRSVTYLSTPFFTELHQPKVDTYHPDCAILNVFNEFDLTQRVVADFSMKQLNGALELDDVRAIATKVAALKFDKGSIRNLLRVFAARLLKIRDSIPPTVAAFRLRLASNRFPISGHVVSRQSR